MASLVPSLAQELKREIDSYEWHPRHGGKKVQPDVAAADELLPPHLVEGVHELAQRLGIDFGATVNKLVREGLIIHRASSSASAAKSRGAVRKRA